MQGLGQRIAGQVAVPVAAEVREFAAFLGQEAGALAVLFYGSNLRTGSLEGVLDYYVLLPGEQRERIWPRVSYRERKTGGITLRAKIATMSLGTFARAARGELRDTTIWARFVQPSALVWQREAGARGAVIAALCDAARTAARFAAVLGPARGEEAAFWRALFRETYRAEFRVEKPGREDSILALNPGHFEGLLPAAWSADGIAFSGSSASASLGIEMPAPWRAAVLREWRRKRRWGKPLNILRLLKASTTFDGAARYAAWKIERHTGVPVRLTPWRERHPVLAAPLVLWQVWRHRR